MEPRDPQSPKGTFPRPVAFVLSGGSSLGAVQVGMLQALLACGMTPDLLVGTSVGALNAAYIGQGYTSARLLRLEAIWAGLRTRDLLGRLGWRSLTRVVWRRGTLASSTSLRTLIDTHLPSSHADLTIPTTVVATNVLTGQSVLLSEGDLRRNVLASAAIPGVFSPVAMGDHLLTDGGLVAHVPLLPAMQLGARTLVVCDAGYPCMLSTIPRGTIGYTLHLLTLMLRHQSLGVLSLLGQDHTVLYLPPPCPLDVPMHDFTRSIELIKVGYQGAHAFLSTLDITRPGIYGHPHFHTGPSLVTP